MNLANRIKQLEATVQEQEATILHLRTANSVLSAKLTQKRRRKPRTMRTPEHQARIDAILARAKTSAPKRRGMIHG